MGRGTFVRHRGLLALLCVFLSLGLLYSFAVPLFEAPDEQLHFLYIRHLAAGRGLPVQQATLRASYAGQESSQPPLYYALGALLVAGRDLSALREDIQDVFAQPGLDFSTRRAGPRTRGPLALFSHDVALEAWPYGDAALAVHLVRLLSLVLGTATVALVYTAARMTWPTRGSLALLAAGLVALNPQFVFISSVINSDNLLNAASGLALCVALRISLAGSASRRWLAFGAALSVGVLAKLSGLALVGLAALAALADTTARRSTGVRLRHAAGLLGPPLVVAGWWFARNLALYGEPLGWPTHLASTERASPDALSTLALWPEHLRIVATSAWLAFGWMNVWAPTWVYGVAVALGVSSLAGWAVLLMQPAGRYALRERWPALLVLAGWALSLVVLVLLWSGLNPSGRQGRLLFPAAGAYGILLATGLVGWLPETAARPVVAAVLAGLAVLCVWAYVAVLLPAYG